MGEYKILDFEEVKNYLRVDIDEDDALIKAYMMAAEQYLENATGKEYVEKDENENKIEYPLEKVFLHLLLAYWYENRSAAANSKSFKGEVPDEFTFSTRSLMLQLKLK